uniref:GCDD2 protein n=1 Tax=Geodia cydonium TaxID=6047 RepID=Q9N9X2_GEOCY|nr:GCDD2 [Geodia cydonium]
MADQLARDCGVDPSALKNTVTDDHLTEIKEFIPWKKVGPRLKGISDGDIDDIDRDGFDQPDKRRRLVNLWAQTNGSQATYYALVEALLKAHMRADAEKVCNLLKGQDGATPGSGATGGSSGGSSGATGGRLGDMPKLGELEDLGSKHIDVLAEIGTDYEKFGIKILEDENGARVDVIKEDQGTASKIKRQIAKEWLKGDGKQPVTWGTLVDVLESIKLRELTKKIREALQ